MQTLHVIILGVVEGITEFLPVSSTGHLTIAEKLLGYQVDTPGMTAFTAIVQTGAIAAAVLYFRKDIIQIVRSWIIGLFDREQRGQDYNMGWYVIVGSLPVAAVGLLAKPLIETALRGLWFVAAGLLVWSVVLFIADKYGTETRHEQHITIKDAVWIGVAQCFALIPGVSRSGSTIAAGLFRGIDRVTATRLSFLLGIPSLLAAGGLEAVTQAKYVSKYIGWSNMGLGIVISFVVGYISIAWLLKFVSNHTFTPFVIYRLALGVLLISLLATHTL